jgi:hypothetical protein
MSYHVWQGTILDDTGNVQPGAKIEVRDAVTNALVELYQDVDGVYPADNPVATDEQGFAVFYAAAGRYTITATKGPYARTWENVRLGVLGSDVKHERTNVEYALGVTPADYSREQGRIARYGAVGAISAAQLKALTIDRCISIRDVNPLAGTGDANVDTQAVIDAANQLGHIGTIYFPQNSSTCYRIKPNLVTFAGPIRLLGDGRNFGTSLTCWGASSGQFLFTWDTGTAARITGAGMKGFYVNSNNRHGCLAKLVDTHRSTFEDIWCEGLQDMFESELGYSHSFYNIESNNNTRYGIHLKDSHNGVLISKCIFDGAGATGSYGVYLSGTALAVNIEDCEFEGFGDVSNYGVVLAPGPGDVIGPVRVTGCAFEQIKGAGLLVSGADHLSVQGLLVEGNSFYGSHVAHYGSTAGAARYAVLLSGRGAIGVTIRGNRVADQETGLVGDQSTMGNKALVIEDNLFQSGLNPYAKISGAAATGVRISGNRDFSGAPVDPVQKLTGAGAVSLFTYETQLITRGANALTLADGFENQRKFIWMQTDGGVATLTPARLRGGKTVTFDAVDDWALLEFTGGQWNMIAGNASLA